MAFKMRSGNRPAFKMVGSSPMKQTNVESSDPSSPITDEMINARREKAPHRWGFTAERGISDDKMRKILENELIRKTRRAKNKNAKLPEKDRKDIVWNSSTESYNIAGDDPESNNNTSDLGFGDGSWETGMKLSNGELNNWRKKVKTLDPSTPEWKKLQNKINKVLGNKKVHN
tara:strand:+ start:2142 stop:2660 length:519 start_codon:yes stop_codon:yes gene_type:complete